MNGWLIMARCAIDEIPMGIERDRLNAIKRANLIEESDVLKQAEKLELDTSMVFNISIIEFKNGSVNGGYELVYDYTEEGKDEDE